MQKNVEKGENWKTRMNVEEKKTIKRQALNVKEKVEKGKNWKTRIDGEGNDKKWKTRTNVEKNGHKWWRERWERIERQDQMQ